MTTKHTRHVAYAVGVLCFHNALAAVPAAHAWAAKGTKLQKARNLSFVQQAHAQILMTANLTGVPIGEAFEQLSLTLPVELTVSRDIAEQRVTVCASKRPLPEFMADVAATLSHSLNDTSAYIWEMEPEGSSGKPVYRLKRTAYARIAERQELEKPRQEAIQGLFDMRNAAQKANALAKKTNLNSHEQTVVAYGSDSYNQGVKALNDNQLKQLLAGKVIVVPNVTSAADKSSFVLQVFNASEREHNPTKSDQFGIRLVNVSPSAWRGLNIARGYEKTGYLPDTNDPAAKIYDLTPLLTAPGVTDEQRTDLAFNLHALSQITGVSVYEEQFVRQVGLFFPDTKGLPLRKGTLPQLVNAICKHWEYQVSQTSNGDLLFWSRHWAQDKQSDISERVLAPWRQVLKTQRSFTEVEYMDMAQKLSYAQVYITLPFAFGIGENAPWSNGRAQTDSDWQRFSELWGSQKYRQRRLTAALTPIERQAAQSSEGIALKDLSTTTQQKILGELHFWNETQAAAQRKGDFSVPGPTIAEIGQGRLFLSKPNLSGMARPDLIQERVGGLPYDPLTFRIMNLGTTRYEE